MDPIDKRDKTGGLQSYTESEDDVNLIRMMMFGRSKIKIIWARNLIVFLMTLNLLRCQPGDQNQTIDSVGGHPISFYLKHPGIPEVFKELYHGTKRPTDDPDVLSLLDSIFTSNVETRPFYLLTLTHTMDIADGAYAEPLGMAAKEFTETMTDVFVDFFYTNRLGDDNFEQWARVIAGEIQISAEGEELQELRRFENTMKDTCDPCNEDHREIVREFVERVKNHLLTMTNNASLRGARMNSPIEIIPKLPGIPRNS